MAFQRKIPLPLPFDSTAFETQTLHLPCASTTSRLQNSALTCFSTAFGLRPCLSLCVPAPKPTYGTSWHKCGTATATRCASDPPPHTHTLCIARNFAVVERLSSVSFCECLHGRCDCCNGLCRSSLKVGPTVLNC